MNRMLRFKQPGERPEKDIPAHRGRIPSGPEGLQTKTGKGACVIYDEGLYTEHEANAKQEERQK